MKAKTVYETSANTQFNYLHYLLYTVLAHIHCYNKAS